jgi:hypothetical protein
MRENNQRTKGIARERETYPKLIGNKHRAPRFVIDVKAYFTIGSQVGFNKLTQRAAAHKNLPLIFN